MLGATHGAAIVEGMAHELMLSVQYEYGQGGKTIFNEVEAYVFGSGVASSYASSRGEGLGSMTSLGIDDSAAAAAWESSFKDLVNNGYSKAAMHNAIYNFKEGAQENQSGENSRYPLRNSNTTRSMLSGFWAGEIK